MFQLPMLDHVERLSVSTKCETCTKNATAGDQNDSSIMKIKPVITDQEFLVVTPYREDIDPMDALKLSKRLVCCTVCGTLRLIN